MEKKYLLDSTIEVENRLYRKHDQFRRNLHRLDDKKDLLFLDFLWNQRKKGISLSRLNKYYETYTIFLQNFNLKRITEEQFEIIFVKIKNSNRANSTKRTHLEICKQILKYFKLHKKIDFEEFRIPKQNNPILNEDLITEDEKHIIISQIKSLKHKVFFTIMFDTGLRVGEVFSINRESFTKSKKGYLITIRKSKTKIRTVFSYSHNDFIDELLKTKWEAWDFGYRTTYNIIKRFEPKFQKRLYHHLARHTQFTNFAQQLTEQELKNYMGLTPNSKVLDNYVHLNNKLIFEKIESLI